MVSGLQVPRRGLGLGAAALLAMGAAPVPAPVAIPRSLYWDLPVGEGGWRVQVGWPETEPPPSGFPVLYLLDGNAHFGTAVEAIRLQARRGDVTGVRPGVIVALGYPTDDAATIMRRRQRDYTPPAAGAPPGSGGADAFLDALAGQVMPRLAAAFPVDAARQAIFGHSYGGLCVLHALFTRPGLFARHVAASPSIWWHDTAVLHSARRFIDHPPPGTAGRGVLITVGGLEQPPPGPVAPGEDAHTGRLRMARMVDRARDLAQRLAEMGENGPQVEFVTFAGETHGSVVPAAISRAMRFVFPAEMGR
ncbi:Alpha/beta hydrolase [Rhodovastum atsumiense]|uniref:Alpha/beta hydrolase n=1 Tax=Rhodovastum atsumiense TaxID=504468 RepID=A0A5M6ITS2_9PROT|nr:alpha/beta hydrolase-fold protein [Rhodovastum atsumiense]KAA5610938.1 alpha/beta hydrolase [Rhodovastum atsumiense]CAH2601490.1 Alpha/beta hydrolase [Rhodovastum atsumiense]